MLVTIRLGFLFGGDKQVSTKRTVESSDSHSHCDLGRQDPELMSRESADRVEINVFMQAPSPSQPLDAYRLGHTGLEFLPFTYV